MDKNKVRAILRCVFGILLLAFALIMLFSFLATVTAKDMFGQPVADMTAMTVVMFWVVILGAGAPGALLLRKAIVESKNKKSEAIEADVEEDSNDEE